MDLVGSWKDLETRGFVVVKQFLSPATVERAARDFESKQAVAGGKGSATVTRSTPEIYEEVQAKVAELLPTIREASDLRVDVFDPVKNYFATVGASSTAPMFHCDPHIHYRFGESYHYLNFWCPFIKAHPDRSGLSVVPMDVLAQRDRRLFDAVRRGTCGPYTSVDAARAACEGDNQAIIDWDGSNPPARALLFEAQGRLEYIEPAFSLDEVAVAPSISAGDALILRGDVLHSHQDTLTKRVALSIRALNGDTTISLDHLLGLSMFAKKNLTMPYNPLPAHILGAFSFFGTNTLRARDQIAFSDAVDAKKEAELEAFESIKPRIAEIMGV